MSDGDKDSFRLDPLVVASALTAILIAGSAYLWRANKGLSISASDNVQDPDSLQPVQSEQSLDALAPAGISNGESEKAKSPRSKERRRRGKDPLRDILKNGKKLKGLSKLNLTAAELDSVNKVKTAPLPSSLDSSQQTSSTNPSIASSRSPSVVSTSRTRGACQGTLDTEVSQPSEESRNLHGESCSHSRVTVSIPSLSVVSGTDISPTTAKTGSCDVESDSKTPHIPPSPAYSEPPIRSFPNSDSISPTILRPTPMMHNDAPIQPSSISISTSSPAVVVCSTQNSPPTELSEVPPLPSSLISHVVTNGSISRRDVINSLHNLRHGPTPRRTPTPSSCASSPPPSLAIQTQIASLRGALEAARQREAQMKLELERHAKDLESMYWERANWKRKEFELQYQVQYLAHQLQSFAVSVSQMNLHVSSAIPSTSSSSRNSSSSPNTSPGNKTSQVSLPPENPLSLHAIPPPPQVQPPPSMFSPLSPMHPLPVYYPYSHMGGNHQPHQQQPHGFSHFASPTHRAVNHTGLMAAFSPQASASPSPGPLASGPSSATASSSSVGSMSPEGVNSSAFPMLDRGRRKTRTTERVGVWVDADGDDAVFFDERNNDGLNYGEDNVSELLADAILKRPGSLGLGKTQDKKSRSTSAADKSSPDSETAQTEFTFPSLSDFGNVKWGKRAKMDGENECRQEESGINGHTASTIGDANATQYVQERLGTEAQNSVSEQLHVGVSDLPDG